MAKPSGQTIFLLAAILLGIALLGGLVLMYENQGVAGNPSSPPRHLTLENIPFNGKRAYDYLQQICDLGPRPSGSRGMAAQQKLLIEHFQKQGGKVNLQQFRVRHPQDGSPVKMANLVVRWHPERKNRILLCAHYDTRPFPDRDPLQPRGRFIGANDGASGVAVLMELGEHVANMPGALGVDFVLFDGEEFIFDDDRDVYFLGSEYFARQYAAKQWDAKYRYAVLLDMVGDKDLQILEERNSLSTRESRALVKEIWATAAKLGVSEFVARPGPELNDDHLPLLRTAKIPAIDIIDFTYPHWHTQQDIPANCSALSLAKVGWVVNEWLSKAVIK
jgi:glutaminyl-peptide cyclotransferase